MNECEGTMIRRKDNKFFVYLPVEMCRDTGFPFPEVLTEKKRTKSIHVKLSFNTEKQTLTVAKL
jgi:hypothetical protein